MPLPYNETMYAWAVAEMEHQDRWLYQVFTAAMNTHYTVKIRRPTMTEHANTLDTKEPAASRIYEPGRVLDVHSVAESDFDKWVNYGKRMAQRARDTWAAYCGADAQLKASHERGRILSEQVRTREVRLDGLAKEAQEARALADSAVTANNLLLDEKYRLRQCLETKNHILGQTTEQWYAMRNKLTAAEQQCLTCFFGDERPVYSQGLPKNELTELVTAEHVNSLIDRIDALNKELAEERATKSSGFIDVQTFYPVDDVSFSNGVKTTVKRWTGVDIAALVKDHRRLQTECDLAHRDDHRLRENNARLAKENADLVFTIGELKEQWDDYKQATQRPRSDLHYDVLALAKAIVDRLK